MNAIDVRGLGYRYPGQDHPALEDIDLRVEPGELVGVLGANGAGKTTLLYALVGLVPHFYGGAVKGTVEVAGLDVGSAAVADVTRHVGFVFANPLTQISGAKPTVYEELAFGLEYAGVPREEMIERIDRMIQRVGLCGLEDRSPLTLSGGELQRVALGSILVLEPEVLLLDEPTSQLDPQATAAFFEFVADLRDRGMTVMVAEHDVDWVAAHADRILALHSGRAVGCDTPGRLFGVDDLAAHEIPIATVAEVSRMLGWHGPDGTVPVTIADACDVVKGRS